MPPRKKPASEHTLQSPRRTASDENDDPGETKGYSFRKSTLTAHPGLILLQQDDQASNTRASRPKSSAKKVPGHSTKSLTEIAQNMMALARGEREWTNTPPMPRVSKDKQNAANRNLVAIGLGKPPSGEAEHRSVVRAASAETGTGSKRTRSDVDEGAPSSKRRPVSFSADNDKEADSLRSSVSGTIPGWRADRTQNKSLSLPQSRQDAAAPKRTQSHRSPNDSMIQQKIDFFEGNDEELLDRSDPEDREMDKGDKENDLMSEAEDDGLEDRRRKTQLRVSTDSNNNLVSDGVMVKSKVNLDVTKAPQSRHKSQDRSRTTKDSQSMLRPADARQFDPAPAPNSSSEQGRGTQINQKARAVGFYSRGEKTLRRQQQLRARREPEHETTARLKGTRTYTNDDLPQCVDKEEWAILIVPSFIHYVACHGELWESSGYVHTAQELWKSFYPHSPLTPALNGDPVYYLLRQRIYEFRSALVDRANLAVQDFFNQYPKFDEPEAIQKYVKWAVPAPRFSCDEEGKRIQTEDHIFPYMYKYNDNDQMDPNDRSLLKYVFRHECILNTFAYFIEISEHLPDCLDPGEPPHIALSLATVAVERALKQWSTGAFLSDKTKFSRSEWGTQSQDVLLAVRQLDIRRWNDIFRQAKQYCGRYRRRGALHVNYMNRFLLGDHSGRAMILDNSDNEDAG